MLILEDPLKCYGLCSTLYVECDTCELAQFFSTGKHDVSDEVPRTMQGKDINWRSVFAANEVGLGREGIAALCEALNMPPPVAPTAWAAHEDELYKQHLTVINEELEKNKQELKELFQTDSSQPDESVLPVSVSFDSTWEKRGFTSNHGVGFVISTDTGKVLDYAVISKACNACKINQKRLSQEELELWRRDHDCVGGYEGSSPSMETECARTLWNKSRDHGLEYRFMVSDGDSKAYNSVWDVYGVCGDCNKYEQMEKSSPEYIKWKNSPEYKKWENDHLSGEAGCHRVVKLDCVGHVQKRIGKALRDVQQQKGKLSDGKPVGGRPGRLTKPAVEKLQKYYGRAIRNNTKKGPLTTEEKDKAIKAMKKEIKAGLYHSCKLPDKERHKYCPLNSWCSYKKTGKPVENKNHHLDPVFVEHLEHVYNRLSDDKLLECCLPGYTQNPNESINSLVWIRCPKHKWFGRKRVEMAAISATLHFCSGAKAKHRVMELCGIAGGEQTVLASEKRDMLRVKKAEKRAV